MIPFVTEQADVHFLGQLNNLIECIGSLFSLKNGSINSAKSVHVTRARSVAPFFRIAKFLQVDISDAVLFKIFAEGGFREAGSTGLRSVADIHHDLHINELQRAHKVIGAGTLISNRGKHRVISVNRVCLTSD